MIDFELDLARFRNGDRRYFDEVMRTYGPLVLEVVGGFAEDKDEGDDLSQEVWLRVYEVRTSYEPFGSFQGWLHQVTLNVCRVHARKKRTWKGFLAKLARIRIPGALPSAFVDPLEIVLSKERRALAERDLEKLPSRQRQAVRLCFLEGRSYREVAKIMGVQESTARSLVRNAFERLRRIPGEGSS